MSMQEPRRKQTPEWVVAVLGLLSFVGIFVLSSLLESLPLWGAATVGISVGLVLTGVYVWLSSRDGWGQS